MALQNNRQLKVSRLEVQKSESATAALRTYRLPQFKVNVMEGQLLTKLTFTIPTGLFGSLPGLGPYPPFNAPITTARRPFTAILGQANQPLSQLYQIGLRINADSLNGEIAKAKLSLQEQTIANDVKKTYYNLVQAQSALVATEETVKLL